MVSVLLVSQEKHYTQGYPVQKSRTYVGHLSRGWALVLLCRRASETCTGRRWCWPQLRSKRLWTVATKKYRTTSRSPSSALSLPTFFGEGSPTKMDYRKRKSGTLILSSPLADLDLRNAGFHPGMIRSPRVNTNKGVGSTTVSKRCERILFIHSMGVK